jgi:hypothetical protein
MRSRNIKPGFFTNDALAECDPLARLLYIGLWCYADKEGRFEIRYKKIKAELFPYDNIDIEPLFKQLTERSFIIIYNNNGSQYGYIPTFKEHQHPHPHETASKIPCPNGDVITCNDM